MASRPHSGYATATAYTNLCANFRTGGATWQGYALTILRGSEYLVGSLRTRTFSCMRVRTHELLRIIGKGNCT